MAARKQRQPEFLTGTATKRMIGWETDPDTDQKVIIEAGEDVKLPFALAKRLAASRDPRVVLGDEERKEAKRVAKREAEITAKRAKTESALAKKREELLFA